MINGTIENTLPSILVILSVVYVVIGLSISIYFFISYLFLQYYVKPLLSETIKQISNSNLTYKLLDSVYNSSGNLLKLYKVYKKLLELIAIDNYLDKVKIVEDIIHDRL